MTIPLPAFNQPSGWVCPKCGRVYAPWVWTCTLCTPGTNQQPITGTGTPFPYSPPGVSGDYTP